VQVMEKIRERIPVRPQRTQITHVIDDGPRTDAERTAAAAGFPGTVLVTGATGFLGHRLVAALHRCGADIVALVRDKRRVSATLAKQATLIQGDIRDPESVAHAMKSISVVYHCAAITTNQVSWKEHDEINVYGTENVLSEALKAGVQRVIHVSSVAVYGLDHSSKDSPIGETATYARKPRRWSHYLRSKLEGDKIAFDYWQRFGLPVTVIRPGILYGPGSGRKFGDGLIRLGSVCLLAGWGNNHLPYTYVDNVVDCLLLAAVHPEAVSEAHNVVDTPHIRMRELIRLCQAVKRQRTTMVPLPASLLLGAAALLEWKSNRSRASMPPRLSRLRGAQPLPGYYIRQ